MKHITEILAKDSFTFMRSIIIFSGVIVLFLGIGMTMKGVAGGGNINVKTAIFEGNLETGTVGLLFSFLGFTLLICCLLYRIKSRLSLTRKSDGSITIEHKGGLGTEKVESIVKLLKVEIADLSNEEKEV